MFKIEKVTFEEISRLEAMAIIDSGKIENLYFIGVYSEIKKPFLEQTEPIKYLSEIVLPINRFFKKYIKVAATPDNYIQENYYISKRTHKWMIKTEKLDLRPKPPIFRK